MYFYIMMYLFIAIILEGYILIFLFNSHELFIRYKIKIYLTKN